jgi:hypothetical protein
LIKMIILGKVQFKHQVNIVVTANKDIGDWKRYCSAETELEFNIRLDHLEQI